MTAPLDVVVLGTTVANGGDAALLDGELATLRAAMGEVAVTIFDQHPTVAARLRPDLPVRPVLTGARGNRRGRGRDLAWGVRLVRLVLAALALRVGGRMVARLLVGGADLADLDRYRRADLVLTPAGTMLVDQHTFLPRLVDWLIAVILGRPLVVFTQTFGTFRRRSDRALARIVLPRAALVLVRGRPSYDMAISLGVAPDRVHQVADPAFLLAVDDRPTPRPHTPGRVALSVREWPFFADRDGLDRYLAALRALCTHLVRRRDVDVELVSTCQGVPEYWTDDSAFAALVVGGLDPDVAERVGVDDRHRSPYALRDHLAGFDAMVATRLHAAILAIDAGTPVVAIAYEPKTVEVFGRLGVPELVTPIDGIDAHDLIAMTDCVLDAPDAWAARFVAGAAREQQDARRVADLLRVVLDRVDAAAPEAVAA